MRFRNICAMSRTFYACFVYANVSYSCWSRLFAHCNVCDLSVLYQIYVQNVSINMCSECDRIFLLKRIDCESCDITKIYTLPRHTVKYGTSLRFYLKRIKKGQNVVRYPHISPSERQ